MTSDSDSDSSRYFVGLMVPQGIGEQLYGFAKTLWDHAPDQQHYRASWNVPADLHCTLLFIGQFSDESYLAEQMTDVAHRLAPITLTVSGQTHWLGRNSLVLAATGAEHAGTAFAKQLGQVSADKRAGKRPFYGHISLGRLRPVPSAEDDHFAGQTMQPLSWNATHVQLVKSIESAAGQRYRVVTEAPFKNSANSTASSGS